MKESCQLFKFQQKKEVDFVDNGFHLMKVM